MTGSRWLFLYQLHVHVLLCTIAILLCRRIWILTMLAAYTDMHAMQCICAHET